MDNLELAKCLEAPEFLSGVALETWNELAPQLYGLSFLKETDAHCLAVYCELWADWLELVQQENPDMDILFKLSDQLLDYSESLGLTPASRLKIQRDLKVISR